jgi:hypothetical protein
VEEVDLDRMIVQCMERQWNACDDCEHDPWNVGRWTPDFMVCPSAPAPTKWLSSGDVSHERNSKGNYAACLGASTYRDSIDGSPEIDDEQLASPRENPAVPDTVENDDRYPARKLRKGIITVQLIPGWQNITRQDDPVARGAWKFGRGKGVKTRRIKDGVSKTIVCSEVLTWDGNAGSAADSEDIRGVWTTPSMGGSTYCHLWGPNAVGTDPESGEPKWDHINGCEDDDPPEGPGENDAMFCRRVPANSSMRAADTWASARSKHNGGVVAGRGDGSVGFFADDVDIWVWRALATRSGGDRSDLRE